MTDKGRMTPGPWACNKDGRIHSTTRTEWNRTFNAEMPAFVASTGGPNYLADARAIACLPELVEAARETLAAFDEDCHLSGLPTTPDSEKLRRILARIDGETGGDK